MNKENSYPWIQRNHGTKKITVQQYLSHLQKTCNQQQCHWQISNKALEDNITLFGVNDMHYLIKMTNKLAIYLIKYCYVYGWTFVSTNCTNICRYLITFQYSIFKKHLFDNVQTYMIRINGTMWKQIKYFLMSTCLETFVKAVWPLSQRPPENIWKYWAH